MSCSHLIENNYILEFNPLFVFPMVVSDSTTKITWELLPEDFVLDNEPVDNVNQPSLAAALTESLELG